MRGPEPREEGSAPGWSGDAPWAERAACREDAPGREDCPLSGDCSPKEPPACAHLVSQTNNCHKNT